MIRLAIPCLLLACALMLPTSASAQGGCCVENENGSGTVTMPATCSYFGSMEINMGLGAGNAIYIAAELKDFAGVNEVPGGNLGGTRSTFTAVLEMTMSGTGALAGFNRILFVPVSGAMDFAPRINGDAVQTFAGDLYDLNGQLFGDPDFCSLQILAGTANGLPSPGSSTLTRLGPAGDPFSVDSFFDVHYTIDFQGCPGSVLEGLSGTTEETDRFEVCPGSVPVEQTTWGDIKRLLVDR